MSFRESFNGKIWLGPVWLPIPLGMLCHAHVSPSCLLLWCYVLCVWVCFSPQLPMVEEIFTTEQNVCHYYIWYGFWVFVNFTYHGAQWHQRHQHTAKKTRSGMTNCWESCDWDVSKSEGVCWTDGGGRVLQTFVGKQELDRTSNIKTSKSDAGMIFTKSSSLLTLIDSYRLCLYLASFFFQPV